MTHIQVVGQRSGNSPIAGVICAGLGQLTQHLLCRNTHLLQCLSDGRHLLQDDSVNMTR